MKEEPLYLKIYKDLLSGIQNGAYPAGMRLPSEKELSEQYSVSRITSKKALEMLAERNVIVRMPGKGSFVLERESGQPNSSAGLSLASGQQNAGAVPAQLPGQQNAGVGPAQLPGQQNADAVPAQLPGQQNDSTGMVRIPGQPSSSAAQAEKSKLIGVVMESFGAAYGSNLLSGIEAECRQNGYHPVLKCTYGSMDAETKAIEELTALPVAGIILMCVQGETYSASVLRLSVQNFPIVLVDRELKGLPIPFVGTDNYSASKELANILFEKGHRNICFLSHPFLRTSSVEARFAGFRDSHLEHNILPREDMWLTDIGAAPVRREADGAGKGDAERIEAFVKQNPQVTAFMAVDHTIGMMVYKVLRRMGLDREKEVVFFDGLEECSDSNPIFTHVVQGEYRMGVQSVRCLLERIKGEEAPETTYIPYQIVQGAKKCYT